MPLRISVIIPARNNAETLDRCLRAVLIATRGQDSEILVVDDASTDATAEIVQANGCRLLRSPEHIGAAAARNWGARHASGSVLIFTDSDIVVPSDCIERALRFLAANGLDAMIGMLDESTPETNFASRYENYYMHRHYAMHAPDIAILYTSFAAIRASVFQRFGGFDPHYRGASIEDMELGQRLITGGVRIRIDHSLRVTHLKRFTLASLLRTNFRKAAGTIRIRLRNLQSGIPTPGLVAPPRAFVAGIPLIGLTWLVLVAGWTVHNPFLAACGVLPVGLIGWMNRGWLTYLRRVAGLEFAFKGALFMLVNFTAYLLGVLIGIAGFFAGKRY